MKTMNTLLLAGAVALGFTLTTTAKADEPFLSPKAAALRHDFRKVSSTDTSPNLVSGNYLGAAAKTEANRVRVVSSGGAATPNLVSGNYLGAGAKNPFPKSASFEIAPLVGKDKFGKTCEAGCTMPCCAKKQLTGPATRPIIPTRAAVRTVVRVTNFMEPKSESPMPLRKVMREWQVTEPLPPRFQEGVWRKIQQAESSATPATTTTLWSVFKLWLASVLPRPAVAVAYVAVLFAVGTASGYWQARSQTTRSHDELGTRYVQAVDPYQKPRL